MAGKNGQQKAIQSDLNGFSGAGRGIYPRPIDYESTGLNSPFDTLYIGLYNLFFGRH